MDEILGKQTHLRIPSIFTSTLTFVRFCFLKKNRPAKAKKDEPANAVTDRPWPEAARVCIREVKKTEDK
jgi:hypothetical protein